MNGLQLSGRKSSDRQWNSNIQISKEASNGLNSNDMSATKQKNTMNIDIRSMAYSKITILLEGIEALGKPPVTKADLHKLFKPFNVDFNDIIVKNNKDCAFVEVNSDKCN